MLILFFFFFSSQVLPKTFWRKYVFKNYGEKEIPQFYTMTKANRKIMKKRICSMKPTHEQKKFKDPSVSKLKGLFFLLFFSFLFFSFLFFSFLSFLFFSFLFFSFLFFSFLFFSFLFFFSFFLSFSW